MKKIHLVQNVLLNVKANLVQSVLLKVDTFFFFHDTFWWTKGNLDRLQ